MYRANSILESDGWIHFHEARTGLKARRIHLSVNGDGTPALDSILYFDRRGHIRMPGMHIYLPVRFHPTADDSRFPSQWLTLAEKWVELLREHGMAGQITLPPDVEDIRPWQWSHFSVAVRYTFHLDFPYKLSSADSDIPRRIRKATEDGFVCEVTSNVKHIMECVHSSEERQGFRYPLSERDFLTARQLLGDERVRFYVAYAPIGEPACATVVLHTAGEIALNWVDGTRTEYLKNGAHQLLQHFVLGDLERDGARGFDMVGAQTPGVAGAKAGWGPRLVPFHIVKPTGLRAVASHLRDWREYRKGKLKASESGDHLQTIAKGKHTANHSDDGRAEHNLHGLFNR